MACYPVYDYSRRICLYSDDHEPPHAHCFRNDVSLGKIYLETLEFEVQPKTKVSTKEIKVFQQYVHEHQERLIKTFKTLRGLQQWKR